MSKGAVEGSLMAAARAASKITPRATLDRVYTKILLYNLLIKNPKYHCAYNALYKVGG